jgi:hypothetical protein
VSGPGTMLARSDTAANDNRVDTRADYDKGP